MQRPKSLKYDNFLQAVRTLRGHALSDGEAFAVSLGVLVWAKLSVHNRLPEECRIESALEMAPAAPLDRVLAITAETYGDGLLTDVLKLKGMNDGLLKSLLASARHLALAGELENLSVDDLLPRSSLAPLVLPAELVSVVVSMGGISAPDTVYAPWDFYGQLAIGAQAREGVTYVETPIRSNVPRLIQVLADASYEVHYSDPVFAPSLTEGDGLRKFDIALGFPPIGLRYEKQVSIEDRLKRFPEHTTSGSVLSIRHLLGQTRRRVVVVVPNSLLSNSGAERALRNDMLERGMVEAVVALPAGLFEATTVATAILVLDPRGGHGKTQFTNIEGSQFCESVSKARSRLTNIEELSEIVLHSEVDKFGEGCTRIVAASEILRNDGLLQVNRYVQPPAMRKLVTRLASEKTIALGELVQTIRPLPPTTSKDVPSSARAALIHEVGANDLPSHGYILRASREISIDHAALSLAGPLFVKPLDIVLIVKGSVGKVGIVTPQMSTPDSPRWVVGQSAIILRVSAPQVVDPHALFVMLRSPMGQQQLRGIVAGTTTPLIQLRELLALLLPLPSRAEQDQSIEALESESTIQRQIDQLQAQQRKAAEHLWSLEQRQRESDPI